MSMTCTRDQLRGLVRVLCGVTAGALGGAALWAAHLMLLVRVPFSPSGLVFPTFLGGYGGVIGGLLVWTRDGGFLKSFVCGGLLGIAAVGTFLSFIPVATP